MKEWCVRWGPGGAPCYEQREVGRDGQVGPGLSLSPTEAEKGSWGSAGVGAWDAEDFVKVSGWSGLICQSGQRPCQG